MLAGLKKLRFAVGAASCRAVRRTLRPRIVCRGGWEGGDDGADGSCARRCVCNARVVRKTVRVVETDFDDVRPCFGNVRLTAAGVVRWRSASQWQIRSRAERPSPTTTADAEPLVL